MYYSFNLIRTDSFFFVCCCCRKLINKQLCKYVKCMLLYEKIKFKLIFSQFSRVNIFHKLENLMIKYKKKFN